MFSCSNFKSLILVIAASFIGSSVAFAETFSCLDSSLQQKFKSELDLSKVPDQCDISTNAEYGKTTITTGKSKEEVPCCAALRIQAHEGVKSQLNLKQQLCSDTKVTAAEQACDGAANCLRNNELLMAAGRKMNALLAQNAGKMKSLGEQCLEQIDQVAQNVQLDVNAMAQARASAPTEQDRQAIAGLRRLERK